MSLVNLITRFGYAVAASNPTTGPWVLYTRRTIRHAYAEYSSVFDQPITPRDNLPPFDPANEIGALGGTDEGH